MNKKYHSLLATAAIATLAIPADVSADSSFKDIKSTDYYADAIESLVERGVINGYKEDNTYRPNLNITRGQAAKIIAGAADFDTTNVTNPNFTDVPSTHAFYGPITALANAGVINGMGDSQYMPNELMTRHQMAKIISLAFDLQESEGTLPFTDVASLYEGFVKTLFDNEITTGLTEITFDGNQYVKRGQLATFVYRAEEAVKPPISQQAFEGTISSITYNTMTIGDTVYSTPFELQ